jgi:mono/diheme cytochrome c family protein
MLSVPQRTLGKKRVGLVLPLALVLCGLGATRFASADDKAITAPTEQELKNPEWIHAGQALFAQTCSYCHGQEGDAGKTQPFREHLNWDPQEIHDTIADGKRTGANIMPPWKASIADPEIWKLVAFIQSLAGKPNDTDH